MSRRQARKLGLSDGQIAAQLRAGRWRSGLPGVYVTYTGPQTELTRVTVAVLYCGEGASASHATAEWLDGLRDDVPSRIHVTVPSTRRVHEQPGLAVHYSSHLEARRHPVRRPPRTRVDETVLDLVDAATREDVVIDVVTRACQRRATTATRLAEAAAARKKLRWRGLLDAVLSDVADGVLSPLERRWASEVERAHALPRGKRNRPERQGRRTVYRDVRYARWRVVVELDGSAAHPPDSAHHDRARDNALAARHDVTTLRYGWREVAGSPCESAAQLAGLLRRHGWLGTPVACGAGCQLALAA